MSPRLRWIVALVAVFVLCAGVVVARALALEARELASRLTGCPAADLEAEMVHWGVTESWRIEGCGIRGMLMCEPTDAGCIIVPDES